MDQTLATDIVAFAEKLFVVDRAWVRRLGRWVSVRNHPIRLLDWQKQQLREVFPPERGGRPVVRNYLDSTPKKTGKSTKAGLVCAFMAATEPNAEIYVCAADRDQARDRIFRSVRYAVEHGPLGDFATAYRDRIEFSNGAEIRAFPMDYRGAAGGSPLVVAFDELHTYGWESHRRLWDEFLIPPTLEYGIRWVSSYAGYTGESLLLRDVWDRVEAGELVQEWPAEYHNDAAGWWGMILQGERAYELVPWTQGERGRRYLAEARDSERPLSYKRLFRNEWVSPESEFIPAAVYDRAVSDEAYPLYPGDERKVWVGVDAGIKHDATALVGCTWNDERKRPELCYLRVWHPERMHQYEAGIDLTETVGAELLRLHQRYKLQAVGYDPYQMASVSVMLQRAGVEVREIPQGAQRTACDQALFDAFMSGRLALYDEPQLRAAVQVATSKETERGLRLHKAEGDDAVVALSMATWLATVEGNKKQYPPMGVYRY